MSSTIAAGEFKARCLQLMDDVQRSRKEIVITKRGKPVAKLIPIVETEATVFDCMKGSAVILADLIAPAVPSDDWELARSDDDADS